MSIEGQRGSIPTGVYNGFSAPVRHLRRGAETRAGKVLMGGIAAAGVLGVALGLFARPQTPDDDGLRLKPEEVVQIEVGPGRTPVVPGGAVQAAPLQTLPAGAAAPTVVVARGSAPRPAPVKAEAPPAAIVRAEDGVEPGIAPEPVSDAPPPGDVIIEEPDEIVIPPPEFADEG